MLWGNRTMTIPINFLTVVLKKAAIETGYPGGLANFLEKHPGAQNDDYLVGVSFMGGGDLQMFVDSLKAGGFDLVNGLAVGELFHGEWEHCNGIEFQAVDPDRPFGKWEARAVVEDKK